MLVIVELFPPAILFIITKIFVKVLSGSEESGFEHFLLEGW